MLQETQRTSAPSAISVSISTAVWTVMCSDPIGKLRALLEPTVEVGAQLRIRAQPAGEGDVRQRAVEPGEQLAQRAQALQLGRSEDAVPGVGPRELDQAGVLD